MEDRRKEKRFPWYFSAMISAFGREHYSSVVDISKNGICVICQNKLGENIPVKIMLSSSSGDVYRLEGVINSMVSKQENPESTNSYHISLTNKPNEFDALIDSLPDQTAL